MRKKILITLLFSILVFITLFASIIGNISMTIFGCTEIIVSVMVVIFKQYSEISFNKFECEYEMLCEIRELLSQESVNIENVQIFNNKK